MNNVNTNWNLGNFTVSLASEVSDDVRDTLASLGLRFLGQRNTEVDKILGAFETVNGKAKRKAGWKRNEVPYDPALASALAKSFETLALPDSEEKVKAASSVLEYIRDTVESKFTEERAIAESIESASDEEQSAALSRIRWTTGIDSIHTEDGEDYSREFLMAIRARKLEKRKMDYTAV
jgi:hypothetical protein